MLIVYLSLSFALGPGIGEIFSQKGTLGMKKSKDAKDLKDSLIPLGIIFGSAFGEIFGMYFKPNFLVFTIGLGAGIGYLFGVIAYGIYSKKE
ncbi:hypothetical protein [Lysinibacillus sp. NPDC059133]